LNYFVFLSAAQLPSSLPSSLPVLTIWGKKDLSTTPAVFGKARKFIRNLQDIALEDIGHWVLLEAKDEVTGMVSSWLSFKSIMIQGKL
jgi:soluble epoxide hydrolase / lipid-phosphate phosphatase